MSKIATREAYGKSLARLGLENKNIVVLDADLSKSTKTAEFKKVCPERFINVGIAEQNLAGISAGLATTGKIPFMSTFAMFAAGRAFEIIRNAICYPNLNVKVCATHAGLTVGADGASHQAIEDLALMRSIPNMVVLNPADAVSADKIIEAAVAYDGPVYVRLGRAPVPVVYNEDSKIEIGKANTIKEGTDVTIIATGIMIAEAMDAAETLEAEGISVRIIDMHTIKPLDNEAVIKAAKETKAIVTAEEHTIFGGLGSAVAEVLVENHPTKMRRIGVKDTFGESGTPAELLEKYGLTANDIVKAVKEVL
ncbi:transketolase family protein [Acidaminobacter sp. JC074]|uniref:transketolase family protein n=1 Tax=Acidaminobacter sp. JC074 TaxID=2530199 RepID=UPI001F104126|nr:transketolase family protein [Acidaminobacter sp. JC074]MCH4889178.1 transketolase family protein [Acidaminobacter sp. JC074]